MISTDREWFRQLAADGPGIEGRDDPPIRIVVLDREAEARAAQLRRAKRLQEALMVKRRSR